MDDLLLQLPLLIGVAVEAQVGLLLRERQLLARLRLRMAGRAVRGGAVGKRAEHLLSGRGVRVVAGRAVALDGKARVRRGLSGRARAIAAGAEVLLRLREER